MGSHIRAMLKSGLDPRPWIDARLAGATVEEAAGVVLRRAGKQNHEWNLLTLMERYRDDHIKVGRIVRGKRRAPSKKTLKDVESAILQQPFVDISALLVRELDERALESYRNKILSLHGGSASRKGLAYVKAALSWARKHHSADAGLVGVSQWWRDVASLHVEKTRDRFPSVEDLGMTIALAEIVRRLPGRSINSRTSDTTLKALWMMVLTSQRREALISTEVGELIFDERAGDGWGILYRPPHVMKSRREHVLPLPPRAMNIIASSITASRSSGTNWLFPATRKGKNEEINHMDGSSVNKLLERLRGRDEKSQSATMPNLLTLAGIEEPNWSPHDARTTFATMVEDWTTRGDAASAVLDHEGSGSEIVSRGAAAITRTAYSQSQRLALKRIAMEPWCNAIIDAVEEARPRARVLIEKMGTGL
ncbi:hypothetical protein LL06_20915 [Hoeflea sp. BAL378]|uniref:hypothetical protein n=1 Tax=Hoeflea sp. BAL378 TaxID=1547437 RepID=UPI000513A327|nr:hypothetical protein LL06_20915 [Hoeflea sp. BAL378]